ncbi:MAG TPA: CsgG/HfaB family protein [Caulobacteraceae bacterium]|nr:CsgG/HfaB family protein [Caulobacteraceae bacterium]
MESLIEDGRWAVLESDAEAKIAVKGVVTKFEAGASGGGLNVGGLSDRLGARAGVSGQKATVVVSLRFVDRETGRVLLIVAGEGAAGAREATAGVTDGYTGARAEARAFRNTPMGEAAHDAIRKAVAAAAAKADRLV